MRPTFVQAAFFAAAVAMSLPARAQAPPVFVLETIDARDGFGFSPSIRVHRNGAPHVAYEDTAGRVHYARRNQSGWTTEDVGVSGKSPALVFDEGGRPVITFINYGVQSVVWDESGWLREGVGGCIGSSFVALAAASDGTAHACIVGSCSGGVYVGVVDYSRRGASGWSQTNLEFRADNFAFRGQCSIAVDGSGEPHISLWNDFSETVGYFRRVTGIWQREAIGPGQLSSIAVDAQGVPHVTLSEDDTRTLRHGVRGPNGWLIDLVDDSGDIGPSSLDIAADGTLHVAYFDRSRGDLRYAYRTTGAQGWTVTVVDSTGDVGSALSLDLDATGIAHIAYLDRTHLHLKYATTRREVAVRAIGWSSAKSRYR